MKIKLTVAHVKCLKCGFERMLYYTPDYWYGERIVSTKSGKYCAYANLLDENITPELKKYCIVCFSEKKINVPESKIAWIVPDIYGITCDDIFSEKIDTTPNIKCVNCREEALVEDKEYGERLIEVEALEVTHNYWENLDEDAKRKAVERELVRQGYLKSDI